MNKNRKKWLAAILSIALLLTAVPGLAAEKEHSGLHIHHETMSLIQDGALVVAENNSARKISGKDSQSLRSNITKADITEQVRETVLTGMLMMDDEIDLSDYNIEYEDFQEIIQNLTNSSADLFYVSSHYSVWTDLSETYVLTFLPEYDYSKSDVEEMRTAFHAAVAQIMSGINPLWSAREKALYVHDYLVSQYEYDDSMSCYDAYSLLVDGSAVCQGYTLAYNYLMERLGIPSVSVPSDTMQHIWNQIELDGEWYHVDMTYDDTSLPYDIPGMALHENFLLSDEGIQKTEHENWMSKYESNSPLYDDDDYFWKNSCAPFQNDGSTWFFTKNISDSQGNAGIYRWNPSDDATELLIDLSDKNWYSGLAIWNGLLYFNTPTQIQYISPDEPDVRSSIKLPELSGNIFSLWIKNNKLEYALGTSIYEKCALMQAQELDVPESSYEWPSPTPLPTHTPLPTPTKNPVQSPNPTSGTTIPGIPAVTPAGVPNTISTPAVTPQTTIVPTTAPQETAAPAQTKIAISAKKGAKKITIRVTPGTKTVISMNKKIMKDKKKTCKKITVSAAKNKSGTIKIPLSSRLKKKMRITVSVYLQGKKTTKKLTL